MPLMLVDHDYGLSSRQKLRQYCKVKIYAHGFFKRLDERALQNLSRGELGFNLSKKIK